MSLPGDLALKNGGDFGLIFSGLFPRKQTPKSFGKSSQAKFQKKLGEIGPGKSGLFGANWGPIRTDSSAPHNHGGRAEIGPKGLFLARLAPFGPSSCLLSPNFDFPEKSSNNSEQNLGRKFEKNWGGGGREAAGTHVGLFLALWARRAQTTPVAGPENLIGHHFEGQEG